MNENAVQQNKLGTQPVHKLLVSMAVPAVIANVVNALYNIVDQIFIGHKIGFIGNAATNVAFPLTTICLAIGLMSGLGAAAGFNLELGRGNADKAKKFAGTAFSALLIGGAVICLLVKIFLRPLMSAFGATAEIMPYAAEYAGITSWGIPFLLFSLGINPLVRGDGSPRFSMASIVVGALINIGLDALFMLVFEWGMAGAAWATVIGQIVSALMLAFYYRRFRNVKFTKSDFIPRLEYIWNICRLGFASLVFQGSMVIVQITLNNLLKKFGDTSVYGSEITIAVAGIMAKIHSVFIALVIGVVQGAQPVFSFNYGARQYGRVRDTVKLLLIVTTVVSTVLCLLIELFPRQIIGVFGDGDEKYFEFAAKYARAFAACMFLNGVQTSSATFFPSIGKAGKGAVISVSKQLVMLVPLLLILSSVFGLDGVMYATPATDALSFLLSAGMLMWEMKHMPGDPAPAN